MPSHKTGSRLPQVCVSFLKGQRKLDSSEDVYFTHVAQLHKEAYNWRVYTCLSDCHSYRLYHYKGIIISIPAENR